MFSILEEKNLTNDHIKIIYKVRDIKRILIEETSRHYWESSRSY